MIDLSDPISRQQAITALRALSDEDGYINVPHEVVTDVVRCLPPAQPKHDENPCQEQGDSDKFGVKTSETCEDCISRQAAIDAIKNTYNLSYIEDGFNRQDAISILEQLPPAPERKTGMWIDEGFYADGHGAHVFRCSECGGHIIEYDTDPFCKWCGADMRQRGEHDGERQRDKRLR